MNSVDQVIEAQAMQLMAEPGFKEELQRRIQKYCETNQKSAYESSGSIQIKVMNEVLAERAAKARSKNPLGVLSNKNKSKKQRKEAAVPPLPADSKLDQKDWEEICNGIEKEKEESKKLLFTELKPSPVDKVIETWGQKLENETREKLYKDWVIKVLKKQETDKKFMEALNSEDPKKIEEEELRIKLEDFQIAMINLDARINRLPEFLKNDPYWIDFYKLYQSTEVDKQTLDTPGINYDHITVVKDGMRFKRKLIAIEWGVYFINDTKEPPAHPSGKIRKLCIRSWQWVNLEELPKEEKPTIGFVFHQLIPRLVGDMNSENAERYQTIINYLCEVMDPEKVQAAVKAEEEEEAAKGTGGGVITADKTDNVFDLPSTSQRETTHEDRESLSVH